MTPTEKLRQLVATAADTYVVMTAGELAEVCRGLPGNPVAAGLLKDVLAHQVRVEPSARVSIPVGHARAMLADGPADAGPAAA